MTRSYELMIVLDTKAEVTDKSAKEIVERMVGSQATIAEVTLLGKKELAYPIKKQTQGFYVLAKLKDGNVSTHEVEKKVQMGEGGVLRFLLVAGN